MRAITDQRSHGLSLVFLFILSVYIHFSLAFDPSSWSHRHMFKRAYRVDKVLAAVPKGTSVLGPSTSTPSPPLPSSPLSLPPLVPSLPFSPLPATTIPTSTTSATSAQTTSISSTPSTQPATTSAPPPFTSSSSTSSSSTSSSTTSSVAQTTSSAPPPVVQQTSPTAAPPTLVAAPAPVYTPDAFTSAVAAPSPTSTPSSSGFFSNTGAVAGTFTVVGLFGIAGIIGVGMLIVRRHHSRHTEEDMEYLDKTPNPSVDQQMREVGAPHMEDDSMTDEGHYGAPPMSLTSPPTAYYPDHAYPTHPQGYPAEAYAPQGYMPGYPAGYAAQHFYRPEDYNIAYPPQVAPANSSMPNPHGFADVELGSTPAPSTQPTTVPSALRPAVKPTGVPQQRVDSRFSVDSFYTGIVTEPSPSAGQAI